MSSAGFGPYQVVGPLGRGGMGSVFEVQDPALPGRRLALKLARIDPHNPTARRRFEREAELLARVRHPGVVTVHSVGQSPEGPWLVMDLVEGRSLETLLAAGPLPPLEAATLTARVADAVGALHAVGVVHRDLKPQNVLLRPDGTPVVIDLGLARAGDVERLTRSGTLSGSPVYMAPEQVDGTSPEKLDARTDVWALGALFYALLVGESPFEDSRSLIEVVRRITTEEPRWPDVPRPLREVLRRALRKRPAERQGDASQLARELRTACAACAQPHADPGRWRATPLVVLALALLLVVVALGAALLLAHRRQPPPAPDAGPASPAAPGHDPSPEPTTPDLWRRVELPDARAAGGLPLLGARLLTWARGRGGCRLTEWTFPARGPLAPTGRSWECPGALTGVVASQAGHVVLICGRALHQLDLRRPHPRIEPLEVRPQSVAADPVVLAISARGDLLAVGQGRTPGALAMAFRLQDGHATHLAYHKLDEGAGCDELLIDEHGLAVASSGGESMLSCPLDLVPLAGGTLTSGARRVEAALAVTALARAPDGGVWVGSTANLLRWLPPDGDELGLSLSGRGVDDPRARYSEAAHSSPVGAVRCLGPDRLVSISSGPDNDYQGPQRKAGRVSELRLWTRGPDGAWTNSGGVGEWPGPLRSLEVSPDGAWLLIGHGPTVEVWSIGAVPSFAPGSSHLPGWRETVGHLRRD